MDPKLFLISALIFSLLSNSPILILAQIKCSPTIVSSVGCMDFLTGDGGTSPTSKCCRALKSLPGTGKDCLCLIVTDHACGKPGVTIKCKGKASAAPLTAPVIGLASLGPITSLTETQIPGGSDYFGPTTSPTSSTTTTPGDQDYGDESGYGEDTTAGDTTATSRPSVPSPSSSHSLKLSLLQFAFFIFEIIIMF